MIEYKKAVPSVEDELKAIIEANKKIAAGDFGAALTGSQELVAAANAAYKAVKAPKRDLVFKKLNLQCTV